jgi:hypothetical protein
VDVTSEFTVTIPPAMADRVLVLRDETRQLQSNGFVVPSVQVPCVSQLFGSAPAGETSSVDVNDGSFVSIRNLSSPVPWITLTAGGDRLVVSPPIRVTGSYQVNFDACNAAGGCTATSALIDVTNPSCTITANPATPILTGTAGVDVICSDTTTDMIESGDGDDIILADGPSTFLRNTGGKDLILTTGVVVTTSDALITVESDVAVLRVPTTTGSPLPTNPNVEVRDTIAPQLTLTDVQPSYTVGDNATIAVSCTDNSGTATCPASLQLNTTQTGVFEQTITATDPSGNTTQRTITYQVNPVTTTTTTSTTTSTVASCTFSGFFSPVDNAPVVNVVKAGAAVPVKFGFCVSGSLNIFASGTPLSSPHVCGTASTDEIESTVTVSTSGLTFDAASGRYQYNWKTDQAWAGQCRTLTLRFVNGTTKIAEFRFR